MSERPIIPQVAVVPFRRASDGRLEVLLVTSRAGRWIVPKGLVDPGDTPLEAAAAEAHEEAGVRGRLSREPVGAFEYEKFGGTCRAEIYLMEVDEVLDEYPERAWRQRRWFALDDAARTVQVSEVCDVLRALPKLARKAGRA